MTLTFRLGKVGKICNSEKLMRKTFGDLAARKLAQRLSELRAFETLAQVPTLPPFRCHQLVGERAGSLAVDVHGMLRVVFRCANEPIPRFPDDGLDKSHVTAICVLEVTDYHG